METTLALYTNVPAHIVEGDDDHLSWAIGNERIVPTSRMEVKDLEWDDFENILTVLGVSTEMIDKMRAGRDAPTAYITGAYLRMSDTSFLKITPEDPYGEDY